jgi:ketosteroid isomerase-like protein
MSDLSSLQNRFDEAWNRHDLTAVLALFAEDGKVNLYPPLPGMPPTFDGKPAVKAFVEMLMPGFHVDSKNVIASGNTAKWFATVSFDAMRADGIASMDADCNAVVVADKITAFNVHFTAESLARVQAAASAQRSGKV